MWREDNRCNTLPQSEVISGGTQIVPVDCDGTTQRTTRGEKPVMKERQLFARLALNPKALVEKPVLKGARLAEKITLDFLAHGTIGAEILQADLIPRRQI